MGSTLRPVVHIQVLGCSLLDRSVTNVPWFRILGSFSHAIPLEIAKHPILKVTCKHFALPLEPFWA